MACRVTGLITVLLNLAITLLFQLGPAGLQFMIEWLILPSRQQIFPLVCLS